MSQHGTQPPPTGSSRRPPQSRASTRAKYSTAGGATHRQPSLANISEPPASITVPPSTVAVLRDAYQPPDHPSLHVAISSLREYLQRTDIENVFYTLCRFLLSRPQLPYNPYPGFVRRARIQAERFHLHKESDEQILRQLGSRLEHTQSHHLAHPVNCNYVWGLRHLVAVVDGSELRQYQWLVQSVTPPPATLHREHGYSNQVMAALLGPSVFHGSLYTRPHTVCVRVEYLITGYSVPVGVDMFIRSLISDIKHMDTDGTHVAMGISVPVQSLNDPDVWEHQHWTLDRVQHGQGRFEQAVVDAVAGDQYIYLECLFRLDGSTIIYRRGQKQYALNFIEIPDHPSGEEVLRYFSEFPLISLHEGVFLNQAQAEAYLAIFTARLSRADRGERSQSQTQDAADKPASRQTQQSQHSQPAPASPHGSDQRSSGQGSGGQGSAGQGLAGSRSQPHRGRVKVDGFRYGSKTDGPISWQITAPIKSHWQSEVARLSAETDLMEITHHVLLLVLMDRADYDDRVLVEVFRILRSSAARLYTLVMLNKTLRELIFRYEGHPSSSIIDSVFAEYKHGIEELFNSKLHERSSDLVTAGSAICQRLQELVTLGGSLPLNRKSVEVLKEVNNYCRTLLLQLSDDALPCCPALKSLIERLQESFPEKAQKPGTGVRQHNNTAQATTATAQVEELFHHGLEDETMMRQDYQVVDIQTCLERDSAPKSVGVEAVILRYLTDTRLDEVWPNYLMDLVSSGQLPVNPFPQFVTTLRQSALRLQLCYETSDTLSQRLMHGAARLEDATNYVYHIPGCDAHGHQSALAVLDIATFYQLTSHVRPLLQRDFIQRRGAYSVAVCCAVTGSTVLYGKMDPYLRHFRLTDHCYIRGPDGCWAEALQIFSKLVYEHVVDLHKRGDHMIMGVYLGGDQTRWNIREIRERKKGFAAELERHYSMHEPVYLKMYMLMDWRYVPVIKYFHLHFINDAETQHEQSCPEEPAALYRNIFFHRERAAFHFQYGGAPRRADPSRSGSVREECRRLDPEIILQSQRQDWLSVYRLLLVRNLMHQGSSLVGEVWRMLHSGAALLEYVISLGRAIQDLVRYMLEDRQADADRLNNGEQDKCTSTDKLEAEVGRMMTGYRQKLEQACSMQCCMAPKSMQEQLRCRLQQVCERDNVTGQLLVIVDIKTVNTLEDISHMLYILQLMVSQDVHSVSPACQAALRSLRAESLQSRPSSVASQRLTEPELYMKPPAACYPDYADEWPVAGL